MEGKPKRRERLWIVTAVALVVGLLVGVGIGYAIAPRPPTEKVLTIDGSRVYLSVLSGPGSDLTFLVGGLPNPTIEVQVGAVVTVYFENIGTIPHSWSLVMQGPPYGAEPPEEVAFPGAETPMAHMGTAPGGTETISFTASAAGTYWYVCHVPGHAAGGMYGKFVVK